jgi:hypothetical protein
MDIRASVKSIALTLAAQVLWVIGVAASTSILVFLFGTTSLDRILRRQLSVPAWTILLAAILVLIFSVVLGLITRKASVVRGRQDATRANLALLRERTKVALKTSSGSRRFSTGTAGTRTTRSGRTSPYRTTYSPKYSWSSAGAHRCLSRLPAVHVSLTG